MHFEILGKDAAALQQFYSGLFGWKIDTDFAPDYGLVDTGGEGINGGIGNGDGEWVSIYVQVDDPARYLEEAVRRGGRIVRPITVMGPVTTAIFADPEGHTIGLVKNSE